MRRLALLSLLALAACTGASPNGGRHVEGAAKVVADPAPLGPARWLLTSRSGVQFDDAGFTTKLGGPEPAIVSGIRVLVDAGVVKRSAEFGERLVGFRSIPKRLGGGFVVWSENRTYRADDFLGELKAIADVGATGGVRPYLDRLLLRTPNGLLEVDPKTLVATRSRLAGLSDAVAIDAKLAIRLDVFGRASVTTDGGATWTDLLAKYGVLSTNIYQAPEGDLRVYPYHLTPDGKLEKIPPTPPERSGPSYDAKSINNVLPTSRALASELVGQAIAAGGFLAPAVSRLRTEPSPGRLIVTRDQGLRMFATSTLLPIHDADYQGLEERFQKCQAMNVGEEIVLACSNESGAALLSLETTLGAPKLEATFPEPGGFVVGPRGHLGFVGRCGPERPGGLDLGAPKVNAPPPYEEDQPWNGGMPAMMGTDMPPPPPPPEEEPKETSTADIARFCVRVRPGLWIERKLTGDDAKSLYRWIPGDDGTAVALVLSGGAGDAAGAPKPDKIEGMPPEDGDHVDEKDKDEEPLRAPHGGKVGPKDKPGASPDKARPDPKKGDAKKGDDKKADDKKAEKPPEGVRVVHVDPSDAALGGAAFPPLFVTPSSAPWRMAENDFWIDEAGGVRGWIQIPGADDPKEPPQPMTVNGRSLRVSTRRGGRLAGARVAADGKVTILPLPDDVTHVVTGGRFAVAKAKKEEVTTYYESTDGGALWTPIEGPPTGALDDAPGDDTSDFGCSAAGCSFGNGVVRVGWGSPKPVPHEAPKLEAATNPLFKSPSPLALRCTIDDTSVLDDVKPKPADKKPGDKKPPPKSPAKPPAKPPQKPPPTKPVPAKPVPAKPSKPVAPKPPPKKPDDKGKPKPPAPTAAAPPPGPISLLMEGGTSLGELKGNAFKTDVLAPFDPFGSPKKISVTDKSLGTNVGTTLALLGDKGAVDLLLLMDKRRMRAFAGPSTFFPFDVQTRFAVASELSGGGFLALDAGSNALWVARGDAAAQLMNVVRVPDVARKTLTLARGPAGALELLAYAPTSGDVVVASLDLARAEVGAITGLGGLSTLTDGGASTCRAGGEAAHSALLELPIVVTVSDKSGKPLVDGATMTATLLVSARADRLCLLGIEARLPKAHAALSARLDKPGASVRAPTGKSSRASCSMK